MKKENRTESLVRKTFTGSLVFMSITLLAFFVGCEEAPVEVYESQFSVFSIITNDKVKQEVIVDRTYLMEEPSEPYVDDALVLLSGVDKIDTLEFSDSLLRYVTSDTFTLLPLETYRLSVVKEGFDTLFAETMTPGDFDFIWPYQGDTMTLMDSIVFRRNVGASVYFCHFVGLIDNSWYTSDSFIFEPVPSETLVKIPLYDYFHDHSSGLYTLKFYALDRNFYEYYATLEDSLIQAGIENGVGLFGSAWVDSIVNYVITE